MTKPNYFQSKLNLKVVLQVKWDYLQYAQGQAMYVTISSHSCLNHSFGEDMRQRPVERARAVCFYKLSG